MHGPDAAADTVPRFENPYPETCLAERLRACESCNSSSDHHNLSNPLGQCLLRNLSRDFLLHLENGTITTPFSVVNSDVEFLSPIAQSLASVHHSPVVR